MSMIDSILIPINNHCNNNPPNLPEKQVLLKDNFLSEFEKVDEKEAARLNLGVRGKDEVYTKEEVERIITDIVTQSILSHNDDKNSHKIKEAIDIIYGLIIKKDGSISFENPQSGVDPVNSNHLTTKNYVDTKYSSLMIKTENKIQELVRDFLARYPKANNIALKDETVRFKKLYCLLKAYTRADGTIPFIKPQRGRDPIDCDHLATKRYVDKKAREISKIENVLDEVSEIHYTKEETYTKEEVINKINDIVNSINFITDSNISVSIDNENHSITLSLKKSLNENNKILFKEDGLYFNVDLNYENGKLNLFVNDTLTKEIDVGLSNIIKSSRYNSDTETIHIEFIKHSGETELLVIPVSSIITEWNVNNDNKIVTLNKERNVSGTDSLSADILISNDPNNIIEKRNDGLYSTVKILKDSTELTHNGKSLKNFLDNLRVGENVIFSWETFE